jgi:hypothetical protein
MQKQSAKPFPALRTGLLALMLGAGAIYAADEAPDAKSLDDYRQQGLTAAMQTKAALGSQLMQAMQAGGPENAVAFCNTQAIPITTGMSETLGLAVTRVSDRPRNPDNAASQEEREIIADLKQAMASGEGAAPVMREHADQVVGYYPIVTNGMCLACHGQKGTDISVATQSVIDMKYPKDQATGYGVNELRGLFVVEMPK